MNPPQVYMCSPSWTLLPPPSPCHPSGSSQCTSPKHPVLCIEPGLASHFIHDILHVSMSFSQIFPPSPSPIESIRLFYISVSLLLSRTQGYCYYLSKFHIYSLLYCIGVFPSIVVIFGKCSFILISSNKTWEKEQMHVNPHINILLICGYLHISPRNRIITNLNFLLDYV